MKAEIIARFKTYVQIDTQSDDSSQTCPTTPGQIELGRMLVDELKSIGMQEVTIDDNGYVMATLPSNTDRDVSTIGFLAHIDTATDFTGTGVNPQVIESYDGQDIVLNEAQQIILSPRDFPELAGYKGQTLITTDGTTAAWSRRQSWHD
jgi:tripeptide aminopeptidase